MSTLRIGIMGAANIARKVVIPSILRAKNVELTALASTSGKGKEFLETTNLTINGKPLLHSVKLHDSYQSLLEDPNVDAVYIGLPNHLHMEWSMKAADAGKHVLCEKPAALNEEQTKKAINHCVNKGIVWMEAFMYRFHPQYEIVRRWIENGEVGKILTVRSMFTFTVNNATNIRRILSVGGGSLYDVGSYCVNVSQWVYGRKPISVSAQMITSNEGVDEEFLGILDFGEGQTALFNSSFNQPYQNEVQIFGTKGSIHIPESFVPRNHDLKVNLKTTNRVKTVVIPKCDQYQLEIEYFAECIFTGKQPEVILHADTITNMKTIDALYLSAKENRKVILD